MKRGVTALLIAMASCIAANYAPLINSHSEQDSCSFGPVSNAEYRLYLSRARQLSLIKAYSLFSGDDIVSAKVTKSLNELSLGKTDVYSRLAMLHATMRALGAEYRNTNGMGPERGRSNPYNDALNGLSAISFSYVLDANRIGLFLPWPREAWIIGILAGPHYEQKIGPLYPQKAGEMTIIFHVPTIEHSLGFTIEHIENCPPIPVREFADKFSLHT
jgi:hypothetical protein